MQIDMKRVDPECNMDRYYSVQLTQPIMGFFQCISEIRICGVI